MCVRAFVAGAWLAFCGQLSVAMRLLIVCCVKRGNNAVLLLHFNRFENRYNIYWWHSKSVRIENKYVCWWLA